MKKHEIVILSLKLLGIYITVQGLSSIGASFGMNDFRGIANWSMYIGFIIYLSSGLVLIFKAEKLSGYILPNDDTFVEKIAISETFQKAALRVIGLYVAIFAFPPLFHIAAKIVQYKFWGSELPEYLKDGPLYIVPFLSELVRFILGLFLALGPGSIIKVLGRFDKTIEKMGT